MQNAKLYEVLLPRGEVYALHDLTTGTIWTERSEKVVRQLAIEKNLTIAQEERISHEQLLRLLGHEPPAKPAVAAGSAKAEPPIADPAPPAMTLEKLSDVVMPIVDVPAAQLPFPVRYHLEDEVEPDIGDALIIPKVSAPPLKSVFCLEKPITPGELNNTAK